MNKEDIEIKPDEYLARKVIKIAEQIAGAITYSTEGIDESILPTAQIASYYINMIAQTIFAKTKPTPANFIYLIPFLWERMENDIQEFTTLDKSWIKKARLALAEKFNRISKRDTKNVRT